MAACSQLPFIPKRDYWYRNSPELAEFVNIRKRFLGDSRPFCGRSDPIERVYVKASRISHEYATSFGSAALGLELDVVVEREMREKGAAGVRRTKLVCTIGPACCSFEDLEKLTLRGMNVAWLNMSHNTRDWHLDVIKKVKRLNEAKGFCVSLMIDTEGSHMHTADLCGTVSVKAEDWDDIEFGISEEVDSIAVSFVKNAEDIRSLKSSFSKILRVRKA